MDENNSKLTLEEACVRLKENDETLIELDLSDKPIGDRGAVAIAFALRKNDHLKVLNLANCNIGPDGASKIGSTLQVNNKLERIFFQTNKVGDKGAEGLANGLRKNATVRTLNLARNLIGDIGAAALADVLVENASLWKLYIYENQIGNNGASALAEVVLQNTTLQELFLWENKIGDAGMEDLRYAYDSTADNKLRIQIRTHWKQAAVGVSAGTVEKKSTTTTNAKDAAPKRKNISNEELQEIIAQRANAINEENVGANQSASDGPQGDSASPAHHSSDSNQNFGASKEVQKPDTSLHGEKGEGFKAAMAMVKAMATSGSVDGVSKSKDGVDKPKKNEIFEQARAKALALEAVKNSGDTKKREQNDSAKGNSDESKAGFKDALAKANALGATQEQSEKTKKSKKEKKSKSKKDKKKSKKEDKSKSKDDNDTLDENSDQEEDKVDFKEALAKAHNLEGGKNGKLGQTPASSENGQNEKAGQKAESKECRAPSVQGQKSPLDEQEQAGAQETDKPQKPAKASGFKEALEKAHALETRKASTNAAAQEVPPSSPLRKSRGAINGSGIATLLKEGMLQACNLEKSDGLLDGLSERQDTSHGSLDEHAAFQAALAKAHALEQAKRSLPEKPRDPQKLNSVQAAISDDKKGRCDNNTKISEDQKTKNSADVINSVECESIPGPRRTRNRSFMEAMSKAHHLEAKPISQITTGQSSASEDREHHSLSPKRSSKNKLFIEAFNKAHNTSSIELGQEIPVLDLDRSNNKPGAKDNTYQNDSNESALMKKIRELECALNISEKKCLEYEAQACFYKSQFEDVKAKAEKFEQEVNKKLSNVLEEKLKLERQLFVALHGVKTENHVSEIPSELMLEQKDHAKLAHAAKGLHKEDGRGLTKPCILEDPSHTKRTIHTLPASNVESISSSGAITNEMDDNTLEQNKGDCAFKAALSKAKALETRKAGLASSCQSQGGISDKQLKGIVAARALSVLSASSHGEPDQENNPSETKELESEKDKPASKFQELKKLAEQKPWERSKAAAPKKPQALEGETCVGAIFPKKDTPEIDDAAAKLVLEEDSSSSSDVHSRSVKGHFAELRKLAEQGPRERNGKESISLSSSASKGLGIETSTTQIGHGSPRRSSLNSSIARINATASPSKTMRKILSSNTDFPYISKMPEMEDDGILAPELSQCKSAPLDELAGPPEKSKFSELRKLAELKPWERPKDRRASLNS